MSTIIYPPLYSAPSIAADSAYPRNQPASGDGKFCTFDCIYCECGYNKDFRPKQKVQTREAVREALEKRLAEMKENGPFPDVLTFAATESRLPILIFQRLLKIHWPCATNISPMPKSAY